MHSSWSEDEALVEYAAQGVLAHPPGMCGTTALRLEMEGKMELAWWRHFQTRLMPESAEIRVGEPIGLRRFILVEVEP